MTEAQNLNADLDYDLEEIAESLSTDTPTLSAPSNPLLVLTPTLVNQIAIELASELMTTEEVIQKFGVTNEQFEHIANTTAFKTYYSDAKAVWHSTGNSSERIRAKGNMVIEDMLLDLYKRGKAEDTTNDGFTKLFKEAVGVSNIAPSKQKTNEASDRFTININIPGEGAVEISGESTHQDGNVIEVGAGNA